MRFERTASPAHKITIPDHRYLRTGTLRSILADVSAKIGVPYEELLRLLAD